MPIEQPGNRFEIELPAEWPPCPRCASRMRIAVATLSHRHVGFFCGGPDMHRLAWTADNGTAGLWIPHDVFWRGGDFEGLIPAHFLAAPKKKEPKRRYAIDDRRKEWIYNEQNACVMCGVPPMRDWHDGQILLDWLRNINGPEFRAVMAIIRTTQPRLKHGTWYGHLAHHHLDLLARINFLIQDSHLQPDHSIPKKVLAALWPAWSSDMRRVATTTLAFGFCRPCYVAKHEYLPSRDELLRRHVQLNHGGSEDVAKADLVTWLPLLRVLDSVDEYCATLTVLDELS